MKCQARRIIEDKVTTQEEELLIAQNATEEIQRSLRKSLLQTTEKETELKEKNTEIVELRNEIDKKDNEIEKLHREDTSLGGSLEIERRNRQKQLSELTAKEGELRLLK